MCVSCILVRWVEKSSMSPNRLVQIKSHKNLYQSKHGVLILQILNMFIQLNFTAPSYISECPRTTKFCNLSVGIEEVSSICPMECVYGLVELRFVMLIIYVLMYLHCYIPHMIGAVVFMYIPQGSFSGTG